MQLKWRCVTLLFSIVPCPPAKQKWRKFSSFPMLLDVTERGLKPIIIVHGLEWKLWPNWDTFWSNWTSTSNFTKPCWVLLGALALLFVHLTILINSVNAPVLFSSFLSWFLCFFHLHCYAFFFAFSLSCCFFIVERGPASVEVKELLRFVSGDCYGG